MASNYNGRIESVRKEYNEMIWQNGYVELSTADRENKVASLLSSMSRYPNDFAEELELCTDILRVIRINVS